MVSAQPARNAAQAFASQQAHQALAKMKKAGLAQITMSGREHLAAKGLGLHCDLQTEHTIVGNILGVMLMEQYGSDEQKAYWLPRMTEHGGGFSFGITELGHGSDATAFFQWRERTYDLRPVSPTRLGESLTFSIPELTRGLATLPWDDWTKPQHWTTSPQALIFLLLFAVPFLFTGCYTEKIVNILNLNRGICWFLY